MKTFTELNKSGQTVVIVTHDPEIAHCTRLIYLIRDGVIVDKLLPKPENCILQTVGQALSKEKEEDVYTFKRKT